MSNAIIGLDMLKISVENFLASQDAKLRSALAAAGDVCVYQASLRAPFLEGHLTASIAWEAGEDSAGPYVVVKVPSNAPAAPYAVVRHEGEYNLGEGSEAKQRRAGVEVGRKYLTRGLDASRDDITLIVTNRLKVT